jgi:DNA helicase HerA-like ATPase
MYNLTQSSHRDRFSNRLPILNPYDTEEFSKIVSIDEIDSHWYILAATRSGKSEFIKLIYIRLVLEANSSIVIFDPHGDLARQCAKLMNDKKDIIYIDPTLKKGLTPTINPFRLEKKDETTIAIVAQEIVIAFESIISVDFSPNMEVLLTPLIYTLLRKGDSGVDELVRFLDDDENEDLIAEALKSPIKAHVDFMTNQFSKAK